VKHEASRYFRNKKREYLKDKIDELATNKNISDLYRGIDECNSGYQPRNNLVKDENGELLSDSHNVLNRYKNYFSLLLNVQDVSDVRQIEIHIIEPLVLGPRILEFEIAIAEFEKYKSAGNDQIPAELIQRGGETLVSVIHKLINFIWNKEELPDQWKESITVPLHKKGDKTDCNNYHGTSLPSTSYKVSSNILLSRLSSYIDEIIRDHECGFQHNR
jgi:hypothetical protein